MTQRFNYKRYCLNKLFEEIPEMHNLRPPLKKVLSWYQDTKVLFPICIYESVLSPYFIELINKEYKNREDVIRRITNLIENLLQHSNSNVRDVAQIGFIEAVLHKLAAQDNRAVKELENYLLPYSLKIAKELSLSPVSGIYRLDPSIWNTPL